MAFLQSLLLLLLSAVFMGAQGQLTGTSVVVDPTTYVAGTTPTSIKFGFTVTTAITGDTAQSEKFTITASQDVFTSTAANVAFSTTVGATNDVATFVAGGVVTGSNLKILELRVADTVVLAATSVVVVTVTDTMGALGAAGQVVAFTMESTQDTTQVTGITGWTTVAAGSGNDPIVRFGDLERAFELPPYVITPLMTGKDIVLHGSVFEGGGSYEQWFDRLVLSHPQAQDRFLEIKMKKNLHEVNVTKVPRRELKSLELTMGYGDYSNPTALSKITAGEQIPYWFLGQEVAIREVKRRMTTVATIGEFPRECVDIAGKAVHMIICSAPAVEYFGNQRDLSLKYAHLDMVFPEVSDFKALYGLLPELWGVQPMSETTKSYLKEMPETPQLDLGNSSVDKMVSAGGLGMEELYKDCSEEKQDGRGIVLTV